MPFVFLWYNAVPVEEVGVFLPKDTGVFPAEAGKAFGIIARKDRVRWLSVQTAARQPLLDITVRSLSAPPIGISNPTCKK